LSPNGQATQGARRALDDVSCTDLCTLLANTHFGPPDVALFREQHINGRQLRQCTEEDLAGLGMVMPLKRRDAIRLADTWARDGVPAELLRAQPALARPERNALTALASPPASTVYEQLHFE
jgi:hypothetical protein